MKPKYKQEASQQRPVKARQPGRLLVVTPYFAPYIGGVEKHVLKTSGLLCRQGWQVDIITRQHQVDLPEHKTIQNLSVHRFAFPKIKVLGLFLIWLQMLCRYFNLFCRADVIHVHDVMVWCLPLRLLLPRKKFVLTVHGWEGQCPVSIKKIWLKKLSVGLANQVVCVGAYLSKYYQIACDHVIEGAVDQNLVQTSQIIRQKFEQKSQPIKVVYLGRLSQDTGLSLLLKAYQQLANHAQEQMDLIFIGAGELSKDCAACGQTLGILNEEQVYQELIQAQVAFVGGYLAALEALAAGCMVITAAGNDLKLDYWQMSQLSQKIIVNADLEELEETLAKLPDLLQNFRLEDNNWLLSNYTWGNIVELYQKLYHI